MQDASSKSAESTGRAGPLRSPFPKSARLLKHSEFERVYRNGRRYSLPDFALFYLPSSTAAECNTAEQVRVGFTVPRALGGAVERNRIRRRMREAVRLTLAEVRVGISADVVMNPRRSVTAAPFQQLLKEVKEAFQAIRRGRGTARSGRTDLSRKDAAEG